MLPSRLAQPLLLVKGATFRQTFLLQQPVLQYRPISTSAATSPVELTVPNHGLITGQAIWIEGVEQLVSVNRPRTGSPIYAEVIDADTLRLTGVNGRGQPRTRGGQIIYQKPLDLTDCTARLELVLPEAPEPPAAGCPAPEPEEPVDPVDPPPTEFQGSIDPLIGKISFAIPASVTGVVTWSRAKFRLWVTMSNGDVDPWIAGEIVAKEAW